jgi:RimJ/RimL family protein N-acetyltransferase
MFDLSHKLIGSIKLGPINPHHKFGEVGLMIGDPEYWGKGFGTNAINILLETFFGTGTLRKATAGVMEANIASRRVFEKSGFLIEGVLQDHVIGHDGELSTVIRYSRFNQPIIENGVN